MRKLGIFAELVGAVYLSIFILNISLLWFLLRPSAPCDFLDRGFAFIRCGEGLPQILLHYYFLYFSPLVAQLLRINTYWLFENSDASSAPGMLFLISFFVVSAFVMISCLWALRRVLRGFMLHRYNRAWARRSWFLLLIILTPLLVSIPVRLAFVPPKFSPQIIHVSIWHGDFAVPRNLLDDWTLTDLERPAFRPDNYANSMTKKWKNVPYLEFDLPTEMGISSKSEVSKIHINPHYNALDDAGLSAAREAIARKKLMRKTALGNISPYQEEPVIEGDWEIHHAMPDQNDYFPDIYISRRKDGGIKHVLECTPAQSCAVQARFFWSHYECGETNCACKKICTDLSQGTKDYDIVYSFDKKYLGIYMDFSEKISAYIASFYSPKTP